MLVRLVYDARVLLPTDISFHTKFQDATLQKVQVLPGTNALQDQYIRMYAHTYGRTYIRTHVPTSTCYLGLGAIDLGFVRDTSSHDKFQHNIINKRSDSAWYKYLNLVN